MNAAERLALIEQYEAGHQAIVDALAGITPAELEAREAPGEWSPRQIVHHLADSEMTSAVRLRLLIAEDGPTLVGYDQEAFVANLYPDRPIEPSLAAFGAARAATAPILRRLTEVQWQRVGTHTEVGAYSVLDWLELYAAHAHDHADQIRRARASIVAQAAD
jgi:hypothetical protein